MSIKNMVKKDTIFGLFITVQESGLFQRPNHRIFEIANPLYR